WRDAEGQLAVAAPLGIAPEVVVERSAYAQRLGRTTPRRDGGARIHVNKRWGLHAFGTAGHTGRDAGLLGKGERVGGTACLPVELRQEDVEVWLGRAYRGWEQLRPALQRGSVSCTEERPPLCLDELEDALVRADLGVLPDGLLVIAGIPGQLSRVQMQC